MILKSWLSHGWQLGLAGSLALVGVLTGGLSNYAFAQIKSDSSLGNEPSRVTPLGPFDQIDGGATRGTNLFHSFQQFNVNKGQIVRFNNDPNIKNVISRVTGSSPSKILGTLSTSELGKANLFFINPNGIIFGPQSRLVVQGSFVATTANAIQFKNRGFFRASEPNIPADLTVNPSAFLFNQIAAQRKPAIINQSVALNFDDPSSVDGLRVPDGQSLLLLGGDIRLEGGQVRAEGGQVELGSVVGTATVGLDNNLNLSFPDSTAQADIYLSNGAIVSASGVGGNIKVQGRRVTLTDGSQIVANTTGSKPGVLTVTASDSIKLSGTATSADGMKIPGGLFAQAEAGSAKATGILTINTGKLTVQDGAVVSASTFDKGKGGTLIVNASDSIKLSGISADKQQPSGLFTVTNRGSGAAGDLTINTGKLTVQDGAVVSASTFNEAKGRGGTLDITATNSIELSGTSASGNRSGLLVGTGGPGTAGDLKIKTERLTIQDGARVSASTSKESTGKGGNIIINTRELNVLSKGEVTVSSLGAVEAGNLEVTARSILLNNEGNLRATTAKSGKGGNITIKADTLVGLDNSDIRADANEGEGGFVNITAEGIFGLKVREELTKNSDITAFSQKDPSLSGVVNINTPDIDPSQGIVALPEEIVDASRLIAQSCLAGGGTAKGVDSKFVVTGRGGLPPGPSDPPSSDTVLANWITLNPEIDEKHSSSASTKNQAGSRSAPIVEAQGWVRSPGGEMVLTAQAPAAPYRIGSTPASCRGS